MKLDYFLQEVYNAKPVDIITRYNDDPLFNTYINLAYNTKLTKYIKDIPEYNHPDCLPDFSISNLSKVYRKFFQCMYVDGYDIKHRNKMLIQVLESLSEYTSDFLIEVIDGNISFFPESMVKGK